jgi:hypothetical protein
MSNPGMSLFTFLAHAYFCDHWKTFWKTYPTSDCFAMVAGMYNRRLKDVDQLWKHINFHITTFAADGTTRDFAQLFLRSTRHYLYGVGHPMDPFVVGCGLVSSEVLERDVLGPLARSQLLLLATTESDLLPIKNHWKIMVCFSSCFLQVLSQMGGVVPLHGKR